MKNKETVKKFNTFALILTIVTFALSAFYNTAFIPTFMLMFSLFIFGLCYSNGEEKKKETYALFILGVLLIIGSLVYTFMRIL